MLAAGIILMATFQTHNVRAQESPDTPTSIGSSGEAEPPNPAPPPDGNDDELETDTETETDFDTEANTDTDTITDTGTGDSHDTSVTMEPDSPAPAIGKGTGDTGGDEASEPTEDVMFDMGLEELLDTPVEVWTATKSKIDKNEAPAIITVVTRNDIRTYGYRTLADVLNHVAGFYLVDDHILPNLGVRGVAGSLHNESGNIKVLVDGMNIAFRSTGGNWLGPELIPLSTIKRIEIIRGPASALYGADAFLGVVNIITISPEELYGAEFNGAGGVNAFENPMVDFDVVGGARKNNFELMLAARVNREDRSGMTMPDSSPAPMLQSYNDGDVEASGLKHRSNTLYARLAYRFNKQFKLQLTSSAARIERGGEFSSWSHLSSGTDDTGRHRGTTIALQRNLVGLQLTISPSETLSIEYKASFQSGKPTDDDRIDVGSDLYYIKRDFGYKALETNLETRWQIHRYFTAIVAGEFISDWENLPSNLRIANTSVSTLSPGDVIESSSTRQGNEQTYNIGAFAQGIWTGLAPYLSVIGGVRFDNHSLYGNQFSGRAGITSSPTKILYIKLLYGSAFKAPSPQLLHGVPYSVGDIIGNPNLKPQKVHTVESQLTLKPNKYFSVSTGVAYSLLKDKAEFVTRGINRVADNSSEMRLVSWESEADLMYNEWIRARLGFEYQWTRHDLPDSNYQSYLMSGKNEIYPGYIARGAVSGRIPRVPLRLSTTLMYVGPRTSSAMNALANMASYDLPAYLMVNAAISTIGIQILEDKKTVVSLIGRNLTNGEVADAGFTGIDYPLQPLSVMLQLTQEF